MDGISNLQMGELVIMVIKLDSTSTVLGYLDIQKLIENVIIR